MSNWQDITENIMGSCRSTFGEEVTYGRENVEPFTIEGIFQRAFTDVNVQAEANIALHEARIDVRRADFSFEPAAGDTVTRLGVTYEVVDVQYDGWAMTRLYLGRF